MTNDTVGHLVQFQVTGDRGRFEAFWGDALEFIRKNATQWLVRHFVRGRDGGPDEMAVADVAQRVAAKILALPGKPARTGWFDADRFGSSPDRLRAWLYPVIRHECVEYCKAYHGMGGKVVKTLPPGDLALNDVGRGAEVMKDSQKVDFDAFELREIVALCVGELPAAEKNLYRLLFVEELSQHEVGRRLGVAAATICRQQRRMLVALKAKLESRGVDGSWLSHAA